MFLILYFFQATLADVTCTAGETLFKGVCVTDSCFEQYLPRIGTVTGGTGVIPIKFQGAMQFVNGQDIQVDLTFNDVENDGTMHRDNVKSCIYDQLQRYKVGYTMGVADKSEIVSTYNQTSERRQWTWTIKAANLKDYLQTEYPNNDTILYTGYYGFVFSLNGGLTQATYRFTFEMTVNTSIKSSIKTEFNSIREDSVALCNPTGTCEKKLETKLDFCITCDCTSFIEKVDLYLNMQFCVKQSITTEGFTDFNLTYDSIYYLGDGMKKKVAPVYYNNTTPGVAFMKLSVEFAYSSAVQILVNSIGKMPGDYSSLTTEEKSQSAQAAGLTTTAVDCVKTNATATECPTCEEQIKNGGTQSEDCKAYQTASNTTTSELKLILLIGITSLLLQ